MKYLDGTKLLYNVKGNRPLLILIPDANKTGNIFHSLFQYLIDHFKVVTFDRCGFDNSKLTHSLPSRVANSNDFFKIK